ncbi:MAG TPA: helix-turn-helix transcriptional regulator [Corynebacterium amycolatum]|nr:helix-turn-helix transcriptional regulator [Corynebacterium amycolatum]
METATLGAFVRQQRKHRGLTQLDVAELVKVSDRFLRELEHGKPTAENGKVIDVLAVLGYDLEPVVHRGGASEEFAALGGRR